MRKMRHVVKGRWCPGMVLGLLIATSAVGQQSAMHPPEYKTDTVQRVAIPLPPQNGRLRLLIISGENTYHHDWAGVNNALRNDLEQTGRFDVRVTEEFHGTSAATLKGYDVVLLNYYGQWDFTDNEDRWDAGAQKALFDFVRGGGGIVVYHASLALGGPSWPEFEHMVGGTMRATDPPSRRAPPLAFQVHVTDHDSPITHGMRDYFWTLYDDMYTNLHWDPTVKVHVLAVAHETALSYTPELAGNKFPSSIYAADKVKKMKGMDQDHPMAWTLNYGRGRVFATTLGHGPETVHYPGVRGLIARGAEWAATGKVTIPVEDEVQAFPIDK